MAIIRAPLFSISASGTIGNKLMFRSTKRGSVASRKPRMPKKASMPQLAERQRVRNARDKWMALDVPTRNRWYYLATTKRMNSWILFFREYMIQQCTGSQFPLIPRY